MCVCVCVCVCVECVCVECVRYTYVCEVCSGIYDETAVFRRALIIFVKSYKLIKTYTPHHLF